MNAQMEPYKIKMVEPIAFLSESERAHALKKAGYNLFQLSARHVTLDFLTDSGTSAMSAEQWAGMLRADESYAGSRSFERFESEVQELTGYSYVIPTHQGRAAERVLFSCIVRAGDSVPSNSHFDTTRANIEQLGAHAVDLVIASGKNPQDPSPFKGNIDLERLDAFCNEKRQSIPLGMLTITNNSCGGHPVSLENIEGAARIFKKHGIPFILDACRFAENSALIRLRDTSKTHRTALEIARQSFSYADGCMISAKKDSLSNIGGFIALKNSRWVERIKAQLILTEGFPTYGGLAARDLEAMTCGLREGVDDRYLEHRVATAQRLAKGLKSVGVPVVEPCGVHAVYIDASAFLPHIPQSQFPGQALACEMYLRAGIRSCEIGSVMFGKGEGDAFVSSAMELVRIALPRRVYTQNHYDYVIDTLAAINKSKHQIRGLKFVSTAPFLRHFTSRFEWVI